MKLLLEIQDAATAEEIARTIKLAREGDSIGGPHVTATHLDNPQADPVYQKYLDAGLECIELAPFMYDGNLVDLEEQIDTLSAEGAKARIKKIHSATETLARVIGELNFERGLLYKAYDQW